VAEIEGDAKEHIAIRKKGSIGQDVKISNYNLNATTNEG